MFIGKRNALKHLTYFLTEKSIDLVILIFGYNGYNG